MNLLAIVLLAMNCPAGFAATPPTDEQVRVVVESYERGRTEEHQRPDPRVDEALRGIRVEDLSSSQLERLGVMLDLGSPELRRRLRARLAELARSPGADGAAAAALIPRVMDPPGDDAPPGAGDAFVGEVVDALIAAAEHPGLSEAVKAGRAYGLYLFMFFYGEHPRIVERGVARRLAGLVDDSWRAEGLGDLFAFVEAAVASEMGLERGEIDRLRETATRLGQRALTDARTDEPTREWLLDALTIINAAAARGELIGGPAPEIQFIWTNTDPGPRRMADLRGKVVVLDFWATWCGPCIASFPHTRELQSRYKDSPVVILGITSLQGWILNPKAKNPSERRLSGLTPEEELRHLGEWARAMEMTWTVAVSKEDCFNREYNVRGLPSVAIIDSKGVVRHAGLSPTDPALGGHIDALLREMGVGVPAGEREQNDEHR